MAPGEGPYTTLVRCANQLDDTEVDRLLSGHAALAVVSRPGSVATTPTLMSLLQKIILEYDDLVPDGPYGRFLGMHPAEWSDFAQLNDRSHWNESEPALKFSIQVQKDFVEARLEIVNGEPDGLRERIWEFAHSYGSPFRPTRSKMPANWPKVYVKRILGPAELEGRALADIETDLRRQWAAFVNGDLHRIRNAVTAEFG